MTLTCIAPTGDVCGEAATWDAASETLWWVDINRFLLHALRDGAVRTWIFEEPVVALSLTTGDRLLVALASTVMLWSPEDGGARSAGAARRLADAAAERRPHRSVRAVLGRQHGQQRRTGRASPRNCARTRASSSGWAPASSCARRTSASPTRSAGRRTAAPSISATPCATRSAPIAMTTGPARSAKAGRSSPASGAAPRTARRSTPRAISGTAVTAAPASSVSRPTGRSTASSRCPAPTSPPAASAAPVSGRCSSPPPPPGAAQRSGSRAASSRWRAARAGCRRTASIRPRSARTCANGGDSAYRPVNSGKIM